MAAVWHSTKSCSRCKLVLAPDHFYGDKRASDGMASSCKSCEALRKHKAHAENPERARGYHRAWQRKNPEHAAALAKARRERHGEKRRPADKAWKLANPEKVAAANARSEAKRRERRREQTAARKAALAEQRRILAASAPPKRAKRRCPPDNTAEGTRWCPDCATFRPFADFSGNRGSKGGLARYCRSCMGAKRVAARAENPEAERARDRMRVRPATEESRARQRRWYERNREVAKARIKASREKRIDAYRERQRAHKKAHPEKVRAHDANRRARLANAPGDGWTAADVAAIREAQKGKCAICREKLGKRIHRDHIVPLSKGGAHCRRNLQLLCEPCNLAKGARDPIDHARTLGLLL